MEFTPNPLAGFSKLIYRARKASGEFEFSIVHLENQSVMQVVFTVYGMKWMANPHPRDLWRVSVFSWLVCVGVLLGGRCWTVPPSSSYFPGGLQSLLTALAHRLEGASRSLGRGRGVCPAHGRRTVKQELVARTNHARLVSSSKQSVQPAGHTVTPGSSQGSTDQEKEQKVNRAKDWGQNTPPNKPGATLHGRLGP